MSILKRTGQKNSIASGRRALDLFADRFEYVQLYLSNLNDDPPRERILYFYGDGGNGKTLLISFLRTNCSKRIRQDIWQYIREKEDQDFIDNLIGCEGAREVPTAIIDFGMLPRGDERPQEAFSALLMPLRQLSRQGLRFPTFEFACICYLERTGRLSPEHLKNLFPSEEMDFITELAQLVSESKWVERFNLLLKLFGKHLQEQFTLYIHKRKLTKESIEELQQLDPETQLMDELPRLFAEDLNAAMALSGAPERVVFFFDTYEAFWRDRGDISNELFFQRDEWLRYLFSSLELSSGIVAVVAGREPPGGLRQPDIQFPTSSSMSVFLEVYLRNMRKTTSSVQVSIVTSCAAY